MGAQFLTNGLHFLHTETASNCRSLKTWSRSRPFLKAAALTPAGKDSNKIDFGMRGEQHFTGNFLLSRCSNNFICRLTGGGIKIDPAHHRTCGLDNLGR